MGLARVFQCVRVLILRQLQVRLMVLKTFNELLNTVRPRSHVSLSRSYILLEIWPKSHVSCVCFLVAVQGRLHCPLPSGQLNLKSCYVSDEPALLPSPSPSASPPFFHSPSLQLSCARLGVGWLCTPLCHWPVILPGQVWEFDGSTFATEHQWHAHWWYSSAHFFFFFFHKILNQSHLHSILRMQIPQIL